MEDYNVRENTGEDRNKYWIRKSRFSQFRSSVNRRNFAEAFTTSSLFDEVQKYNYLETSFILKPPTVDEQIAERPWVKEIEKTDVSNETWKCFTIFLLESEPSFYGIVNFINKALGSRKRKAIRLINDEMIKKAALDHCFSSGERTPFATLCEAVKREAGKNFESKIQAELLAYMIKYIMLQEREHYLKMKDLEDKLKYRAWQRYDWLDNKYGKMKGKDMVDDTLIDDKAGLFEKGQTRHKFVGNRKKFELHRMKRKLKKVLREFSKVKKRYQKIKEKHLLKKKYKIRWKTYKRLWKVYVRYIKKCNKICVNLKMGTKGEKVVKTEKKGKHWKPKKKEQKEESTKLPNVNIIEENKLDTFLCKRGELSHDLYAIDDSPLNGPQIYFILSSFRVPDLPELLHQLNVPINGYIFIGHVHAVPDVYCKESLLKDTFNDDIYKSYMKEYGEHVFLITECTISFQCKKKQLEPVDVFDTIKFELEEFYKTFIKNLTDQKTDKHYENSIIKDFVPDLTKINFNLKSWVEELVSQLYTDISELVYHYFLISQVYEKYLRKVQCQDLTDLNPFSTILHLQIYNTLLDGIPNEIISVPLILDTIISQVCYNEGSFGGYGLENYIEYSENKAEELLRWRSGNNPCEDLVEEDNIRCLLFNDKIQIITSNSMNLGEFVKTRSDYILSLYFNHIWYSCKTKLNNLEKKNYAHHYYLLLQAMNSLKIKDSRTFLDILLSILSLEIKNDHKQLDFVNITDILTELLSTIVATSNDTNINEVNSLSSSSLIKLERRLFKQNVQKFESSSSSSPDVKNNSELFKLEKVTFLQEIISKIVENKIFESLIKIRYFEELPKRICLQVLWEAFEENIIIEKYYMPLIKKMMFICYNDSLTLLRQSLLPTIMNLRDFARYAQIEQKDWYNANYKNVIQDNINKTFSTTEYYQLKNNIDDKLKSNTLNECHLMLPLKYRLLLNDLRDSWVPYEFKSYKLFYPNNLSENMNTESELDLPVMYNFGEMYRTTLFTKTRTYVLCDSTVVTFKNYGQLYTLPTLLIEIKQNFHRFTYHTPLGVNKEPASILYSHFNGIKVVFYEIETFKTNKDLFSPNILLPNDSEMNSKYDLKKDTKDKSSKIEDQENVEDQFPPVDDLLGNTPAKFECKLSLPNGLYLENVHVEDGIHYVKQKYLTKDCSVNKFVEEEICRLYLNDGTVIKLLKNSATEIYYACGRWVRITKFENAEVAKEEIEHESPRMSRALSRMDKLTIRSSKKSIRKTVVKSSKPVSAVRPRVVFFQPYQILEPDGKLYEFINDIKIFIKQINVSEYVSIMNDRREICIEEGPTININSDNVQSVSFLDGTRISSETHIEKKEIFCDWSISEIKLWFKNYDVEEELDDTAVQYEKIDLSEDGFLWVSISYMIEHPDFVKLVTYPFQSQKMAFMLQSGLKLVRFGNGCFDLEIEDNTILLLRHNQIVLDKMEDLQSIQRAVINYKVFREINETPQLIFNCRDLIGNLLRADTTGCILYTAIDLAGHERQAHCEKEVKLFEQLSNPANFKNNTRRFVVDKHFTGHELLSTMNMTDFQEANDWDNCAIINFFKEDPFIGHIFLLPICNQQWKLDYCDISNDPLKLPSTYGTNWLFPLYMKRQVTCGVHKLVMARFINEFNFGNMYQVLHDIMLKYLRLLIELDVHECESTEKKGESEIGEYDCLPTAMSPYLYLPFRQRDRPNSRVGKEATKLRLNLRNSAEAKLRFDSPLLTKVKKQYKECKPAENLPIVFNYEYFLNMCRIIRMEEFGQYFECSREVALHIIDTVITRVLIFSDLKYMKELMDELFGKPLTELTEEDLDRMEVFLNIFYCNIWGRTRKKTNIKQILLATKRLDDFYPNMKDALNLNLCDHGMKYTIEDACEDNEAYEF